MQHDVTPFALKVSGSLEGVASSVSYVVNYFPGCGAELMLFLN